MLVWVTLVPSQEILYIVLVIITRTEEKKPKRRQKKNKHTEQNKKKKTPIGEAKLKIVVSKGNHEMLSHAEENKNKKMVVFFYHFFLFLRNRLRRREKKTSVEGLKISSCFHRVGNLFFFLFKKKLKHKLSRCLCPGIIIRLSEK